MTVRLREGARRQEERPCAERRQAPEIPARVAAADALIQAVVQLESDFKQHIDAQISELRKQLGLDELRAAVVGAAT